MNLLFNRKNRGRVPDIVIIGAQKCGTTSLYKYLLQHKEIEGGKTKEIHFFDRYYWRGRRWYESQFKPEKENTLLCEATPVYFYDKKSVRRIQEQLPDAKFIVVLRDPIDRSYSGYIHNKEVFREKRSFAHILDSAISGKKEDCIERSRYVSQLEYWFTFFPNKEQTLILQSENLFENNEDSFSKLHSFLGIENQGIPFESHNARTYVKNISFEEQEKLQILLGDSTQQVQRDFSIGKSWGF